MLRKLVDIATTLEYLGITHNILRNASRADEKGDPNFPPVKGGQPTSGYMYDVSEVTEWAKKRRATEAAERARVKA
jgi:transcriptional regulator of nitric oxide reductase